ncbi:MAG: hypothetical protein ACR2HN_09450 [Tepidiformaceae bacterium]
MTEDKDFGDLVIRDRHEAIGVVLLRLAEVPIAERAALVSTFVQDRGEELAGSFTVLTERGARIRPLPEP